MLTLIAEKPWLGWGELDYAHFITLYSGPRFCEILDNAHNLPLHLAVELGLPAVVVIYGALSWLVWRAKPWAETDAARQMAWGVLAIILLHSLLEYPLWYGPFQMAVGLCVVMLWQRQPATGDEKALYEAPKMPLPQSAYGLLAILLIAICGYAAWDYQRISQLYLAPESRSAAYRTDTLAKVRSSWLFASQVQFAELMTTPLEPGNAVWTFESAGVLLHEVDRYRVISVPDVNAEQLKALPANLKPQFWAGSQTLSIRPPKSAEEQNNVLFDAASGGRDYSARPEFYIPYDDVAALKSPLRAKPLAVFLEKQLGQQEAARKLATEKGADMAQWLYLPVVARQDWVAVLTSRVKFRDF